jgi:hypothetical protein
MKSALSEQNNLEEELINVKIIVIPIKAACGKKLTSLYKQIGAASLLLRSCPYFL